MAWLGTIPPEAATGRLGKLYDSAVQRAGRVFGILRAMSLTPRTLEASMALYGAACLAPAGVSRREREVIAVVVSRANDCYY